MLRLFEAPFGKFRASPCDPCHLRHQTAATPSSIQLLLVPSLFPLCSQLPHNPHRRTYSLLKEPANCFGTCSHISIFVSPLLTSSQQLQQHGSHPDELDLGYLRSCHRNSPRYCLHLRLHLPNSTRPCRLRHDSMHLRDKCTASHGFVDTR